MYLTDYELFFFNSSVKVSIIFFFADLRLGENKLLENLAAIQMILGKVKILSARPCKQYIFSKKKQFRF